MIGQNPEVGPKVSWRERRTQARQQEMRQDLTQYLHDTVATIGVDGVHRAYVAARTVMSFELPTTDTVEVMLPVGDSDMAIPYRVSGRDAAEFELTQGLKPEELDVYGRLMKDGRRRRLGNTGVEWAFSTYESGLRVTTSPESTVAEEPISA